MADKLMLKISHNDSLRFFSSSEKNSFTLGSDELVDDIYIRSPLLSGRNLMFFFSGRRWYVVNKSEAMTIRYGKRSLRPEKKRVVRVDRILTFCDKRLNEKITLSAIRNIRAHRDFAVKCAEAGKANSILTLEGKNEFFIGRDPSCDIVVDNPQVDPFNTRIIFDGFQYYIEDQKSSNGTSVNGSLIKNRLLTDYDFINIASAVYMFRKNQLIYSTSQSGIDLDVVNLTKMVRDNETKKPLTLLSDISMAIRAGEFVAVVGGSGAGKSTFLDAVNGRRPATTGKVFYDLNDYYENMLSYQSIVGYVPQKDIMHDKLTVRKTLTYYAAIRMRSRLAPSEIDALVNKAMKDVSLSEKAEVKISALSGGQRKRVSIAMELLADPKIIFLDEPTSGLSPDLDYEIMSLLSDLSKKQGRTIVVITHAMDNVDKCDKLAFLGKGGRLCYYGKPSGVFKYFDRPKFSHIFALLSEDSASEEYAAKLKLTNDYRKMRERFDKLYTENRYEES